MAKNAANTAGVRSERISAIAAIRRDHQRGLFAAIEGGAAFTASSSYTTVKDGPNLPFKATADVARIVTEAAIHAARGIFLWVKVRSAGLFSRSQYLSKSPFSAVSNQLRNAQSLMTIHGFCVGSAD